MKTIINRDPYTWTDRQFCGGCHSLLEYSATDVKAELDYSDDYEDEYTFYITCPTCNCDTLANKPVPYVVKKWAINKLEELEASSETESESIKDNLTEVPVLDHSFLRDWRAVLAGFFLGAVCTFFGTYAIIASSLNK